MESQKGFVGVVLLVLAGFFALAVVGSAMNLITIPWLKFDSQVQTNRDIIKKTYNADNALYNYHWFQERSGSIKALGETIAQSSTALESFEVSAGARKDWTFEDKTEDSRLRQVVLGQKAQYNSLVNEYNARAGEVDRAIFQDGLPLFFSIKPF